MEWIPYAHAEDQDLSGVGLLSGSGHPQVIHFHLLIVLSRRHLKNHKCKERLSVNSTYLSKDRASKEIQVS